MVHPRQREDRGAQAGDVSGCEHDRVAASRQHALERGSARRRQQAPQERAVEQAAFDPGELERTEERLFALRAAARKHDCRVDQLPALRAALQERLTAIDEGAERGARLERELKAARGEYDAAAARLSAARKDTARALEQAVAGELAPLKLERAEFTVRLESDAAFAGPSGIDRAEFWVRTNPGTAAGPLRKIASGGELARFILALKVALADRGSAPTLVFDEVDTAVGGAVADAIGQRLARLAGGVQVISVTHAPQVAARAGSHMRISKDEGQAGAALVTQVAMLDAPSRQEEIARMLSGDHDEDSALLSINAGAGGVDSQDWAQMLLRMYNRYLERSDWKVETLDLQAGEEAGIKSAVLEVDEPFAYGYLKSESGVHRLVRISPFDSQARRHTSFASVFVYPLVSDDVEVEIDPNDLRIDTYRAQGAGGQHVNKTDSAIRITHEPTGIVVQCQSERSQHRNRESAMTMLRAKLYQKIMLERQKERDAIEAEKMEIAWGSQIRSYVLQPYTKVKDHRTEHETGNAVAVLDGDLDEFVEAYLRWMGPRKKGT